MLSQEAIQKILGIEGTINLVPEEMVKELTITFFPENKTRYSQNIKNFADLLQKSLVELGVKIIPYEDSLEIVPISKVSKRFFKILGNNTLFVICETLKISHNYHYINLSAYKNLLKRYRIKRDISVVTLGEGEVWELPIDYTSSFTRSSIITILDKPNNIGEKSSFQEHFDTAMDMFTYHMTQIVILVDDKKWILYNFNASHPIYPIRNDLKTDVLRALMPKIAAPIRPNHFSDFVIEKTPFDPSSLEYKDSVNDLIEGGKLFDKTHLYPKGKKIDDLPFRNKFYRWIGSIHLDYRSGMSYGFLARQLPTNIQKLITYEQARKDNIIENNNDSKECFFHGGRMYIILDLPKGKFVMKIPKIWVLTQRSGADKTHIDAKKDLLMLGLIDGRMYIRRPLGLKLTNSYKPSFDTRVILAHALGNAIIGSILDMTKPDSIFVKEILNSGLALAHWHGYFHPNHIPEGWYFYGCKNPHVACSTPQSAIFALQGKLNSFEKVLKENKDYRGDIHIEPHHGTNIVFPSIKELAKLLTDDPLASSLGNKYLEYYH